MMIAAGLLAFMLNVLILRNQGEMVEISVATQPIASGSRLRAEDIGYLFADAGGPLADRVLTRDTIERFIGHVVVHRIESGDPLMANDLKSPADSHSARAMSIPISADHAVGAALHAGDRIDVISVDDGASWFVATDIEILAVAVDRSRSSSARLGITVAVSAEEALAITAALDRGAVHLVRSTGAAPIDVATAQQVPPLPMWDAGS